MSKEKFKSKYDGKSQIELLSETDKINDQLREIADKAEEEKRDLNDNEQKIVKNLIGEKRNIEIRMNINGQNAIKADPETNRREKAEELIEREVAANRPVDIVFLRDVMMVADAEAGSIVHLNIQDILQPLEEGFILDKLGLPFKTGLTGEVIWPVAEAAEAFVMDEGEEVTDTHINLSSLKAVPQRIATAVPMTQQSINRSNGYLETIVRQALPTAMRNLLNRVVLSPEPFSAKAKAAKFYGPFVEAEKIELSAIPTYDELSVQLLAKILESGVAGDKLCITMTKRMERVLMGQPINKEGIFMPMIAPDHTFSGIPVYTTNAMRSTKTTYKKYGGSSWAPYSPADVKKEVIKYRVYGDSTAHAEAKLPKSASVGDVAAVNVWTEYVGAGDFTYLPMGMFGSMRMTVDPYTRARRDEVDFVLNADFSVTTLRPEAFAIGKVAVSK